MKVFRCRICGEAYIGPEKPSTCPFCGAHENFFVFGKDWKDENKDVELSEKSRKNLETTLNIEIANAKFYKCAYKKAIDPEVAAMFKSLAKMEAEHADVAAKLLNAGGADEAKKTGECEKENDFSNINESHQREERAIRLYKKFQEEAVEQRIKTVFGALVEIENDHLSIGNEEIKRLST